MRLVLWTLVIGCAPPADVPVGAFGVDSLQGAVELDHGAGVAFARVPASVVLSTGLSGDESDGLVVVAVRDGEEIAEAPWEGVSLQGLDLPAPVEGDTVQVVVTNRDRSQAEHVLALSAHTGPVTRAEPVEVRTWREAVLGPLGDVEHTFVAVGTGEQIELFPTEPDDPFAGATETTDLVAVRLLDDAGRPAAWSPVAVSVEDPSVVLVRAPVDPDPAALLRTRADGAGFVAFFVDYVGPGASGLTLTGLGDTLDLADGGGPVVFACHDPAAAVIHRVRVTEREGGGEVNEGLQEGGTILVFGETYCFGAEVTGTVPEGAHVTWCLDGEPVTDAGGDPITGEEVCIPMPEDPDPDEDGDDDHLCLTAKIQTADGEEMESEESLDFDLREKKAIPICVHEFGPNGADNGADDWQAEIERVNEAFEGTGVCLVLAPGDLVQHGGADKEVRIRQTPETLFDDPKRTLSGALPQCVADDPSLAGQRDKITLYYGVNVDFTPGAVGAALGADEVYDAADIDVCYDIEGDYANTAALGSSLVPATDNALAHEIGHLLGLGHRDESGALMRKRAGEATGLNPDEAATVYDEACDILAGD